MPGNGRSAARFLGKQSLHPDPVNPVSLRLVRSQIDRAICGGVRVPGDLLRGCASPGPANPTRLAVEDQTPARDRTACHWARAWERRFGLPSMATASPAMAASPALR